MKTEEMLPDLIGEQCRILYLSDEKNQVVLGVAGSGKSVEAIYRAFWLSLAHPNEKILILTYNNQINQDLEERLAAVRAKFSDIDYPDNIEIQTIYTYFKNLINKYRRPGDNYLPESDDELKAMTSKEEREILDRAIEAVKKEDPENSLWNKTDLRQFVQDEFQWMQKMDVIKEDEYLTVNRIGRSTSRILARQRPAMFKIFRQFYKERKSYFAKKDREKYFTFNDIYLLIEKHCEIPEEAKPQYIIIDEVQDVTPAMFKGLQSVIRDNGIWNVFGDLSQNIFGGQISWRSLGIRTSKIYRLYHNYRNTKEIGSLGKSILDNILAKQDNVAGNNSDFFIEPELSAFTGAKPILCQINNEMWLDKLHEYVKDGTTAVLTLGNTRGLQEKLEDAGFNVVRKIEDSKPGTVYIQSVGRSKGLEFDNVVVYGINSPERGISTDDLDDNNYLINEPQEDTQIEIGRTIYVALTRARKNLILTYHNSSLPFLFTDSELIEKVQA